MKSDSTSIEFVNLNFGRLLEGCCDDDLVHCYIKK